MQKFFKVRTQEEPTRQTVLSFDPDTTPDINAALKRAILTEFSDFSGEVDCVEVNRLPDDEIREQLGGLTQQLIQLNQRIQKLGNFKKFLKLELRSKFKILSKFKLNVERSVDTPQQRVPTSGDGNKIILQEGATSELAPPNTESTRSVIGGDAGRISEG